MAENEIELTSHWAVIEIPENAVEIKLECKVYENGGIINVGRTLGIAEVREAFRKADDGYIDDDDRFVLTEEGDRLLDEMRNAYGNTQPGA